MASSLIPASSKRKHEDGASRKPQILIGACGSVAAVSFGIVCRAFHEWAEVRGVVTKTSLRFLDYSSIPKDVFIYWDDHDWLPWRRVGDDVLHIELSKWADIMVIAPLSANTLAKIAGGLCDNLLTRIVRAWDYGKPMFVAPSMNSCMWRNPSTEKNCMSIEELGISLILPSVGNNDSGATADPSTIYSTVRLDYDSRILKKGRGEV